MKIKTIFSILLLSLSFITQGQTKVFQSYDFEKGGYYILGTFSESDKNALRDSIGEFYSDDIAILNQFKNEWVFDKPGKKDACGYHYNIEICKNGEVLEHIFINLSCNEIVFQNTHYTFDPNKLRVFKNKLKKPIVQRNNFETIEKARVFREDALTKNNLIMVQKPHWVDFEGSFRCTYQCKSDSKDCLDEDGKIFNSIKKDISKKYPNEKFEVVNVGGSLTTIDIEINCNKSLSDKFDMFSRDNTDYSGKWKPFYPTLKTYWTNL